MDTDKFYCMIKKWNEECPLTQEKKGLVLNCEFCEYYAELKSCETCLHAPCPEGEECLCFVNGDHMGYESWEKKKDPEVKKISFKVSKSYASMEEMIAEFDRQDAEERKKTPVKWWAKRFWMVIWHRNLERLYSHIRWVIRRDIPHWLKYGCSEYDIWALDYSTAKWILPRLRAIWVWHYKNGGMPCDFYDDQPDFFLTEDEVEEAGKQKWLRVLDKMIRAFEIVAYESDGDDFDETMFRNNEVMAEYEEGMELFRKYFYNLWT